jgi:hypothetical protein
VLIHRHCGSWQGLGSGSGTSEILGLYHEALAALGITRPSYADATRWWLRELARKRVAGQIPVGELIGQIVPGEAWMTETEFDFACLAYYWHELVDPASVEQVHDAEADLRAEAETILAEPIP